jgi:hypothetical protein
MEVYKDLGSQLVHGGRMPAVYAYIRPLLQIQLHQPAELLLL